MKTYDDIKRTARAEQIPLWKIAMRAGISEATLTRLFRTPETADRLAMLSAALTSIMKERDAE